MTQDDGIKPATLDWSAPGETGPAPRSLLFDDIYFADDGPAETAHVFLAGNDLPQRFNQHPHFVIGELGFGTGLNFLCAWDSWRRAEKPERSTLTFFSVEAFPLSMPDMKAAHEQWPQLAALSETVRAKRPPAARGLHHIALDDETTLLLYYGEALEGLAQFDGRANAWFLDGFAPSKNPAMWSPELMRLVAQRSADAASFATFTVAGAVRRALQSAGFDLEKTPGFGKKRDMLRGRLNSAAPPASAKAPWFSDANKERREPKSHIAIIGGGIAGASLAHAATRQGLRATLFEEDTPASGASGNTAGLIMPRLDLGDTPAARFHLNAYIYTLGLLGALNAQSSEPLFNPCGTLFSALTQKETERQAKIIAANLLPTDWLIPKDGGLFFPQAGVIDPPAFVKALIGGVTLQKETVTRLIPDGGGWRVHCEGGEDYAVDAVVIANGLEALKFVQARSLPLSGSAGQIDYFPHAAPPPHAHAFGPYAAPAPHGGTVIGATYAPFKPGGALAISENATRDNISAITSALPDLGAALEPEMSTPRAAVRCVTPDRLPIAGAAPDWGFYSGAYDGLRTGLKGDYPAGERMAGLYALTGLGSRGLVTAPLAAAMIIADIAGAPCPVERQIVEALDPARFFIRDLKRTTTRSPG